MSDQRGMSALIRTHSSSRIAHPAQQRFRKGFDSACCWPWKGARISFVSHREPKPCQHGEIQRATHPVPTTQAHRNAKGAWHENSKNEKKKGKPSNAEAKRHGGSEGGGRETIQCLYQEFKRSCVSYARPAPFGHGARPMICSSANLATYSR